jgi:hypothetical protein
MVPRRFGNFSPAPPPASVWSQRPQARTALDQAEPAAQAPQRGENVGELLERLEGHPLSLWLVLPRLEDASAADLIAGLARQKPLPADRGDEDLAERHRTLDACVAYSLDQLPNEDRERFFALALFEGCINPDVLNVLSKVEDPITRFHGVAGAAWAALLERAAAPGLLSSFDAFGYRLQPGTVGIFAGRMALSDGRGVGPGGSADLSRAALDCGPGQTFGWSNTEAFTWAGAPRRSFRRAPGFANPLAGAM